ncbi:helix-turn-helix domain-containing protein [Hamadaea tsunoensis]|uniref:helix-turn-helix domain-containing protein n=1 Tax=Hamadaea tsunoensis TaxID=53368 RepID=UPI0038992AB7
MSPRYTQLRAQELGRLLRRFRTEPHLSITDVASGAGVDTVTASRIEAGGLPCDRQTGVRVAQHLWRAGRRASRRDESRHRLRQAVRCERLSPAPAERGGFHGGVGHAFRGSGGEVLAG